MMDNNMDTINSDNADSDSKSDDGLAHKNPCSALLYHQLISQVKNEFH